MARLVFGVGRSRVGKRVTRVAGAPVAEVGPTTVATGNSSGRPVAVGMAGIAGTASGGISTRRLFGSTRSATARGLVFCRSPRVERATGIGLGAGFDGVGRLAVGSLVSA